MKQIITYFAGFFIIVFFFSNALFAQDSVEVTFYYDPSGDNPTSVYLPGEFNGWNIYADPMTYDSDKGVWYKTKLLRVGGPDPLPDPSKSIPGAYQYKFNLNGSTWISDPRNFRINNRDNNNSFLFITDPTIHYLLPNETSALVETRFPEISAYLFPATTSQIDTGSIKVVIDEQIYENIGSGYDAESHLFTFTPSEPLQSGLHSLKIMAKSVGGEVVQDSTGFTIFTEDDVGFISFLTRDNPSHLRSFIFVDGMTDPFLSVKLVHAGVDSFDLVSDPDGFFSKQITLLEGENTFQAFAEDTAGVMQSTELLSITYYIDHAPKPEINISADAENIYLIGVANDPDGDVVTYQWTSDDENNPEPLNISSDQASFSFPIPSTAGEYYIDLLVEDPATNQGTSRTFFYVFDDGSVAMSKLNSNSAWIQDAIVYEIFVPAFTQEGTIAAAKERLPEIKKTGANVIWFMPIFENGESINTLNAGYNTTDFFKVHPQLGTLADLTDFIASAKALGIRVILDVTPNHSSGAHPFVKDIELFKDYSIYRPMFETEILGDNRGLGQFKRTVDGYTVYVHYSNWSLANFDYTNIEARNFMLDVYKYWLLDVGVDGYRMDVYWGPQNRYGESTWWRPFREEIKRVKPDALLLGETDGTGIGSEINYADGGGALDAGYDWSFYGEIKSTLNGGSIDNLDNRVRNFSPNINYNHNTGPNAHYFRFLENHDETRIAELFPANKTKVAATLLFTVPGIPLIYAGQEVGETSRRDLINWNRSGAQEMLAHYEQLGEIRMQFDTFASDLIQRESSGNSKIYAYVRPHLDQNALVVHNFSGSELTATISLTNSDLILSDSLEAGKTYYMNDVLNNAVYQVSKSDLENFQPVLTAWNSSVFILADSVLDIIDDIPAQDNIAQLPKEFSLAQNYPNPFNPSTTIAFTLPQAATVSLQVFDVLGRKVFEQNLQDKAPGAYEITWNATNQQGSPVGSGVYFYKIMAIGRDQQTWSASRKMILLR